ncbi:MAG: hypothetical protein ABIY52_15270 [Gemmatimonadaceae bacterium]
MSFELSALSADDAERIAASARAAILQSSTLESAARTVCAELYDGFRGSEGTRDCVMVRCYITHPYGTLTPDIQRFAKRAYGAIAITPPEPEMRCLVLLGTVGDEPEWNERQRSRGHQAIPLPSPHVVERAPMIAQLVRELGLDLSRVIRPAPDLLRGGRSESNGVFHVEQAKGSPYVPAQADFVERYGVRSVLGFGGALPSGDLFAIILFARVTIESAVAVHFRTVAADVLKGISESAPKVFD